MRVESITIEHLRGIQLGSLTHLGDVNLLVGRNNSGKSTIVKAPRDNELPVRSSKRALHLIAAITAFRASPATLAERLTKTDPKRAASVLAPLLAQLVNAVGRFSG